MINIIILIVAATVTFLFKDNDAIIIISLSVTTILLIVFGNRFKFEEIIENNSLPGREAWLPIVMIGIFFLLGFVDIDLVIQTLKEKIDIILLIFSFAMISYGMAKSGFFEYLAYQIVEKCGGNTNRLILYLFILSSILTLITSNDIVILILTPIIYSICVHAHIKNSKLLLLSQFVAANTLSMGFMIGSPTNIIIAEGWDISFFTYFNKMIVPAILSFAISLAVVAYINLKFKNNKSKLIRSYADWDFDNNYQLPAFSPWKHSTQEMKNWGYIFFIAVILLIVVTNYLPKDTKMPLLWSAIPTMILVTVYIQYRKIMIPNESSDISVSGAFISIPYGILFFGISFFIVAKLLAQLDLVEIILIPAYESLANDNFVALGVITTFFSGLLVNLINDLPAAAVITEVLPYVNFKSVFHEELARTALLVGVNIGCYVTPVGALAGLIWLNVINSEKKRHALLKDEINKKNIYSATISNIKTPNRIDLVKYGSIHFIFVAVIIGLLLPFFQVLEYSLTVPSDGESAKTYLLNQSTRNYVLIMGFVILIFLYSRFKYIIKENDIILGHLSEIFSIVNKIVEWSLRNRFLYTVVISFLFLGSAAFLLNWSESKFMEYHAATGVEPLFKTTGAFIVWLLTFISSSYEANIFPRSMLGQLIAGTLPLVAIASILFVIRLTSSNPVEKLQKKLSRGDIPSHRVVIINYEPRLEGFVSKILNNKATHVTLLCNEIDFSRASTFVTLLNKTKATLNRTYADIISKDPYATFTKYNLESANEIFMFSKMTVESDYINLKMMTKLDSIINDQRIGASEVVENYFSTTKNDDIYSFHSHLGVVGVPHIVVETSNLRQKIMLERSISNLLAIHSFIFENTEQVSRYLISDITNDLDRLNDYFFNFSSEKNHKGFSFDFNNKLIKYELEESSISYAQNFFKNKSKTLSGKELSKHSLVVRNNYDSFLKGILLKHADGSPEPLTEHNIVGLISKITSNNIILSFSSASLSTQTSSIESILCFDTPIETQKPLSVKNEKLPNINARIFIINYTNNSHALIKKLLKEEEKFEIIILAKSHQNIPDWIAVHSQILINSIDQSHGVLEQDSKKMICNQLSELQKGDRIYIFADYEKFDISEQTTLDTIERIEKSIYYSSARNDSSKVSHIDIQISVESHNEEMRFLFEHLHVDKIIETTRLRRSYIELFGSLYYTPRSSNNEVQKKLYNTNNFFQTCKLVDQLKSYIVSTALDYKLITKNDTFSNLVGYTVGEARNIVMKYSSPPVDLAFVISYKIEKDVQLKNNFYLKIKEIRVNNDEIIDRDDIILFFPNL